MVIQHNMSALNADRMLGITHLSLADSAEKLSSGYKINRAADDAAGLSISEKMRKKIRGLERGMENVQDGISLCQVADGALNEVADMLQRIRELSIQAYNGTNSKNDRHMIQDEVSQCIDELDRVFETTKFNEIYIFRNGTRVQGETFHPETYIVQDTMTAVRDIPAWLTINDKTVTPGTVPTFQQPPGYLQNDNQDINGIMKQDCRYEDPNNPGNLKTVKLYLGKNYGTLDGYQWAGDFFKNGTGTEAYNALMQPGNALYDYITQHLDGNGNYTGWTPELKDNLTAKLNFSGLTSAQDASDLYDMLGELVGTEVGFSCGSCSLTETVRFGGEYIGMRNVKFHDVGGYIFSKEINLSQKTFQWEGKDYEGYFNAIIDVMSDPAQAGKTAVLAEAIAKDLAQSVYDVLNGSMTNHFDRAIQDANDPYSVYVYDYRDVDGFVSGNANSIQEHSKVWTYSMVAFDYDREEEGGYFSHYDYWDANQIWIQASDEVGDGIPIYSHHLSAEVLNLKDYRIDTYASEIIWEDEDAYQKRYLAWLATIPEPKTETYKKKVNVVTMVEPPEYEPYSYYEDGEHHLELRLIKPGVYETKEEEREYSRQIYDMSQVGPKPVRQCTVKEVYAPSELSLIDDAMEKVMKVRSYYGAVQNRLEHTYKNNYNADENITDAESRIRDTDMAKEMVRNSLLNILQQAGLSMLSQANQTNQGVSMLLS